MKKVLFLTWDGPQVNYLESLFLPIFKGLEEKGFEFHVIQYTWGDYSKNEELCDKLKIPFTQININRKFRPFGETLTILKSISIIKSYVKLQSIDIIMPRSIFPLIPVLFLKNKMDVKVIFDADGLLLDEKVEFNGWSNNSLKYRLLRFIEKKGLVNSNAIITRTQEAKNILIDRAKGKLISENIFIVSNGRDPNIFYPSDKFFRHKLGISHSEKILIYVGSVGKQYGLNEMILFYKMIKKPKRFIILTNEVDIALEILKINSLKNDDIILKSIFPSEVPKYLQIADLALSFRIPSFSMKAVSPIKLGEYLLCGLPVISTANIGNTEEIIVSEKCGYILKDFSEKEFIRAINWYDNFNSSVKELHNIGLKHFSLQKTVNEYYSALNHLNK